MDTQQLQNDKLNIIQIKSIMSTAKDVSLTLEQRNAIDDAFVSIEKNGTKSHDAVMEQTKKKFPQLFQK